MMNSNRTSSRFSSVASRALAVLFFLDCAGLTACNSDAPEGRSTASAARPAAVLASGAAAGSAESLPSAASPSPSSPPSAGASASLPDADEDDDDEGSASDAVKGSATARPKAPPAGGGAAAKPDPSKSATKKPASPSPSVSVAAGTAAPTAPGAPTSAASSAPALPTAEAPAPALPNSADAVAEKVDAIYVPIQRFRARFQQRYTAKIAGTTKNSEGVCYIKRPGKVSFSYHSPNKNRVVSDGVTLKIYEAENQQMFTRPVATTEYPGALAFILGRGLRYSFTFAFNESAKWEGGPVIVGTPRVPNPGYEKVLFYIDEELMKKGDPACVRRVLVIDAQGNRNRFDFIHVEQPETIPDGEFEFTPPPGTNVLQ